MGKFIDLTGQRFGRLVAIERAGSDKRGQAYWLCRCDCGHEIITSGKRLRHGETQSCGCLRQDASRVRMEKIARVHGGVGTRLYRIWHGMHTRCYNSSHPTFKNYGGRGITVCDEWLHDFIAFRDWAQSHGYADTLSIDRIDNDKGYSPDNCRWATMKEQAQNRRPKRTLKIK